MVSGTPNSYAVPVLLGVYIDSSIGKVKLLRIILIAPISVCYYSESHSAINVFFMRMSYPIKESHICSIMSEQQILLTKIELLSKSLLHFTRARGEPTVSYR